MPCNHTNIFGNKIQHLNALKLLIGSTTGIRFTESRQRLVVITSIFQCDNITLSQSRNHHGKFVKITSHPSKLLLCFTSPEISILPLSLRFVIRNAEKSVEIFFTLLSRWFDYWIAVFFWIILQGELTGSRKPSCCWSSFKTRGLFIPVTIYSRLLKFHQSIKAITIEIF